VEREDCRLIQINLADGHSNGCVHAFELVVAQSSAYKHGAG